MQYFIGFFILWNSSSSSLYLSLVFLLFTFRWIFLYFFFSFSLLLVYLHEYTFYLLFFSFGFLNFWIYITLLNILIEFGCQYEWYALLESDYFKYSIWDLRANYTLIYVNYCIIPLFFTPKLRLKHTYVMLCIIHTTHF